MTKLEFSEDQLKLLNNSLNLTYHTYRTNGMINSANSYRDLQDELLKQWAEQEETELWHSMTFDRTIRADILFITPNAVLVST